MPSDKINEDIARQKKLQEQEATRLSDAALMQAVLERKKQLQEMRTAAIKDEQTNLFKKGKWKDKDGNDQTLWDVLMNDVNRVLNAEQSSIHDWRSAMMSLLSLLSQFVGAATQSIAEIMSPVTIPLKHALKNALIDAKDYVVDNVLRGSPRLTLPKLVHTASLDENNKLVANIKRVDNKADVGELPQGYRTLISLWLAQQGYVPDPNNEGGYRAIEGHAPLTAEQFKNLRDDPENGLNTFLNESSELEYDAEPEAPQPSMR